MRAIPPEHVQVRNMALRDVDFFFYSTNVLVDAICHMTAI